MVAVTREIGRAMATQVDRVNQQPDNLLRIINELREENRRLRQQIRDIVDRQAAALPARNPAPTMIPVSQAARRAGVSVSTVNRHLNGKVKTPRFFGELQGNTWLVYASANGDPLPEPPE